MELRKMPISMEMSVVLLTKYGTLITELRKIPISMEMSMVLLTKDGTLIEIPSAEEPVATRRNVPLALSDLDHLFVYHKCNKTVQFRPKGGEVYVFRPDDPAEINDWVSDKHVFM